MNSGAFILCVIASVLVVSGLTVFVMRVLAKKFGTRELLDEGVVLGQDGIESPRFMILGRTKVSYCDIESVSFVPFPESLTLRLRYGPSVSSQPGGQWFSLLAGTVVVKLKPGHLIQYRLFTPNDPKDFIKRLQSRINSTEEPRKGT